MNFRRARRWMIGLAIVIPMCVSGAFFLWRQTAPIAQPDKLTLAVSKGILAIPLWVAEAQGFYRREGLEVTVRPCDIGKQGFEAMLRGEVDVTTSSSTPIVLASFARHDFVVLANMSFSDNSVKIIARRDRGIRDADDLKGKTIGVAKGSISEFFLEDFLAFNALPPTAVTIKDVPMAETPDRLKRGEVDAVSAFEPYAFMAQKGLGNSIVVIEAPGIYRNMVHLVARREFASTHLPVLVKLLRALARADDFIHGHPDAVAVIMAQVWGFAPADAASLLTEVRPSLSLSQAMLKLLEDEARWALQHGLVEGKTAPNYIEFIDSAPLKAVRPNSVTLID